MISFKQFLSEKAMNASEFSKTEARQGGTAHVGFEFECIVTADSPLRGDSKLERDYVSLNRIKDLKDLSQYFGISKGKMREIQIDFEEWEAKRLEDDQSATWDDFVDDQYGQLYKLVSAHGLEPIYGWEADTGQDSSRVYSEDETNDEDTLRETTFRNVENDLTTFLGANVTTDWKGVKNHYAAGDWVVVADGSIDPEDGGVGVEINSPPQKLTKALRDLKTMFKWMDANHVDTNESTGLHINISMPGIQNVDLVKLVLFMGDKHVLRQFDRLNNMFTRSQAQSILNNVTGVGRLPRDAKAMVELARSALSDDKYSSVHITKLQHGYLEFRIAGGAGYHHKYDMIRDTVLRFVTALEIAIDPKAERNEYLKKLSKIFDIAEGSNANHDLDNRPLADILEIGDEDSTAEMLNSFLVQAKEGKLDGDSARERASTWFHDVFLKSLFRSFSELNIRTVSDRQKAEFKLIMKRLGMNPKTLTQQDGFEFAWKRGVLQKFGF
jgi:hypothetical protein